jgi:hypothetical protein
MHRLTAAFSCQKLQGQHWSEIVASSCCRAIEAHLSSLKKLVKKKRYNFWQLPSWPWRKILSHCAHQGALSNNEQHEMKALKVAKGLDVSDAVDAEFWLDCTTEVLEAPAPGNGGHGQSCADPAAAILQPSLADTEFPDGRVLNNEAIYRIRRKHVSDRLRDWYVACCIISTVERAWLMMLLLCRLCASVTPQPGKFCQSIAINSVLWDLQCKWQERSWCRII